MADDADHRGRAEPDPFPHGRDPLLSPLPPPRPVLHEVSRQHGAGWEGMSRSYMTLAAQVSQHLPEIYNELDEFRAAINTLPDRMAARIDEALHRHGETWDRRRKLPSLSEYNPDYTPAGGIKFDSQQFAALSQRMAAYEAQLQEAKQAADLAAAEKRGAEHAKAELEEKTAKFRKNVSKWVKIVIAVGPPIVAGLTYLITHLAKL